MENVFLTEYSLKNMLGEEEMRHVLSGLRG